MDKLVNYGDYYLDWPLPVRWPRWPSGTDTQCDDEFVLERWYERDEIGDDD